MKVRGLMPICCLMVSVGALALPGTDLRGATLGWLACGVETGGPERARKG